MATSPIVQSNPLMPQIRGSRHDAAQEGYRRMLAIAAGRSNRTRVLLTIHIRVSRINFVCAY
ncbi:hypothetical protein PSAC2689_140097 [Paraburkholderia sacchari]